MLCCAVVVCCAEDLVSCCEVVLVNFGGIAVVLRVLEMIWRVLGALGEALGWVCRCFGSPRDV